MKEKKMYVCEFCSSAFESELECKLHELAHRDPTKLQDELPPKFEVGDIVSKNDLDLVHKKTYFVIEYKHPKYFADGSWKWIYTLGYDYMVHPIEAEEANLSLVMRKAQADDVMKKLKDTVAPFSIGLDEFIDLFEQP